MISDALTARLAALRAKYVKTFEAEALALDRDIDSFAVDAEARELIRRRAHRLAGTAGSYSLAKVQEKAEAVEALATHGAAAELIDAAHALAAALREDFSA